MNRIEKLAVLNRFSEHRNSSVCIMIDCAVENAGFNGKGGILFQLDEEAISEIYSHLLFIVDGNLIDCSADDLKIAREVFKG